MRKHVSLVLLIATGACAHEASESRVTDQPDTAVVDERRSDAGGGKTPDTRVAVADTGTVVVPADAPPADRAAPDAGADRGVIEDARPPADAEPGGRVSLRDQLMAKWVGTRRTIGRDGDTVTFTGEFEANKFGGPQGHNVTLMLTPGTEYLFEYRLRFDGDFPWTKGGKIPGLAGGNRPTGCVDADPNGFSARMMWKDGGKLVGYTYDLDQSGGCGNSLPTSHAFKAGQWYAVKERVKLNTGRNHDGVLQIWVDEKLVLDRKNMGFMAEAPANKISMVLFHSFFGGSTQSWAPAKNCSITFAEPFATKLAD